MSVVVLAIAGADPEGSGRGEVMRYPLPKFHQASLYISWESTNQTNNQPINQPTNQPTTQQTNITINQSTIQSLKQSTNQQTN